MHFDSLSRQHSSLTASWPLLSYYDMDDVYDRAMTAAGGTAKLLTLPDLLKFLSECGWWVQRTDSRCLWPGDERIGWCPPLGSQCPSGSGGWNNGQRALRHDQAAQRHQLEAIQRQQEHRGAVSLHITGIP